MTYEKFNQFLVELKDLKEIEREMNKVFKKFSPDFNYFNFGRYEELVVHILKESFNDTSDWIGYWIYERDWKPTKGIKSKDGKNIPLRNNKDLYNLLTKVY